jgi:hypothetical protein
MIQIHIPKFSALHRERHMHKCPLKHNPRKPETAYQMESNEICAKVLAGTGLDFHVFPCALHVADYRTRFGIDTLLDSFIDLEQAARFTREWPDAHIEERERGEAGTNTEIADVMKRRDEI